MNDKIDPKPDKVKHLNANSNSGHQSNPYISQGGLPVATDPLHSEYNTNNSKPDLNRISSKRLDPRRQS